MSSLFNIAGASSSSAGLLQSSSSAWSLAVKSTTSTSTAAATATASIQLSHRTFTSSRASSQPEASSPKARRAHEKSLRSAIELYHLAASFFPTPAQTAGFGASLSPPEPEPEVHSRSVDAAIRTSIRVTTEADAQNRDRLKGSDAARLVLALRPQELLDSLAEPGPPKDGRAEDGPIYEPGMPAPLAGTGPGLAAEARVRALSTRDSRTSEEAEKSLDRIFAASSNSSSSASAMSAYSSSNNFSARSHLRFVAPRHPTAKQGAYAELLAVQAEEETTRRALEEDYRRYVNPTSERATRQRGGRSALPAASKQAAAAYHHLKNSAEEEQLSAPQASGARGVSFTAEADRLDERSARIRDALFGTVAAELPGLEVLQERRRLRKLREG
ncbi:hypothetical protein V8E36_000140 [Tilletia maclaganii]